MREHGGNIDAAIARFGAAPGDWIDLSTGINRVPYPVPPLPPQIWQALPTAALPDACLASARTAYGTAAPGVALAGAQAAIQLLPHIHPKGRAAILSPTYNEHAGCFRAAGWDVAEVTSPDALSGADAAVVVNPNNPTGTMIGGNELARLADGIPDRAILVLDGAYAEFVPGYDGGTSLATDRPNVVMTRTFSKLYGLGGLRIGWGYGPREIIDVLNRLRGPFNLSGTALAAAAAAIRDRSYTDRCLAENARLRGWLGEALAAVGVPSDVSHTNFILARFRDAVEADACDAHLKRDGLIVRKVAGYGLPNCLRITVGDGPSCQRVVAAIKAFRQDAA